MRAGSGENPPVRLFISYSHKDEDLRRNLENHLVVLQRAGLISVWNDRGIENCEGWQTEINTELNQALERHHAGEATVIPVIMRPCLCLCLWSDRPLASLQALP